jgi:hypothetical protein
MGCPHFLVVSKVVFTSFRSRAKECSVYFVSSAVELSSERGSVCLTVCVVSVRTCGVVK